VGVARRLQASHPALVAILRRPRFEQARREFLSGWIFGREASVRDDPDQSRASCDYGGEHPAFKSRHAHLGWRAEG